MSGGAPYAPGHSVPKIESIRPGGTLEASFSRYPLAELLLGILRGNLSGRLELFLHPEPRNLVVFKDGVPVSVQLPDSGVSMVKILIDSGEVPHDRGLDLLRIAEASGRSEEAVIQSQNVLTSGALDEARRRRARAQVVKLFDVGSLDFRFAEGAGLSPDMPLTILQPLPMVFEGLRCAKDKSVVNRFLQSHARSGFELSPTFPRGVDPFEWGPQVERVITAVPPPLSVARLVQAGLSQELAAVALTSLFLADMLDLRDQGAGLRPAPAAGAAPIPAPRSVAPKTPSRPMEPRRAAPGPAPSPSSGLMIHRRSGGAQSADTAKRDLSPSQGMNAARAPEPRAVRAKPAGLAPSRHDAELASVRQRLAPVAAQNYFQVLRVTTGTNPDQVERAYRFLLRRVEDEGNDDGWRATKDLLREAYELLVDPDRAAAYAEMVERAEKTPAGMRERQAFEAEPKVDRAVRVMAEGRTGEATFLLAWAEKLDPSRLDVPVLMSVIDFLRAPRQQRGQDAKALQAILAQELARQPHDWRLKLCQARVLAELSDSRGALALVAESPEADHPMVRLVQYSLRANGSSA